MPSTSTPSRTARIVAAPITLLMPGAGPPPHRIARRWMLAVMHSVLHGTPAGGFAGSGKRDFRVQIHVLDGIQQPHTLVHRALERLAPRDQAHAARALVDHRRPHRLG